MEQKNKNTLSIFQRPVWVSLFALTAAISWGWAYPLIKMGMEEYQITADMTGSKMLFAGIRFFISGIIILAIASAIVLYPPQDKITQGLDIQGGVSVNLKASTTDGSPITAEQMEQTQKVISNRVNASGAAAATIQQQGSDAFLVQVPGAAENSQAILDTLSSQGVLEFVNVATIEDETARNFIMQGLTGMNLKKEGVAYKPFMTGENVEAIRKVLADNGLL